MVDPGVPGPQLARGGADGLQAGQVEGLDRDVRAGGGAGDAGGGGLALVGVPHGQHHRRPARAEDPGGLEPQAGVRAGDHGQPAVLAGHVIGRPSRLHDPSRCVSNYDVRLRLILGWTSYISQGKVGSMPRRTDSRSRMIHAAAELFRQRGYHATTFSDVVRESGAPRGATYFHFPGGKAELAREAIARAGDEVEEMVDQAARHADDPGSLVRALAQILASRLERSGYQSGCAIAP